MVWVKFRTACMRKKVISSVLLIVTFLQCMLIAIYYRNHTSRTIASKKNLIHESFLNEINEKKSRTSSRFEGSEGGTIVESIEHEVTNDEGKKEFKFKSNHDNTKLKFKINDKETKLGIQVDDTDSVCLSPEKKAKWILDGTCMDDPYEPSFSTGDRQRSCGFCGNGAQYLKTLRDDIAAKYSKDCKDLVVYGAALGKTHEKMLRSRDFLGTQSIQSKKLHKTCFFQFTTDGANTGDELSADGSQILIIVDPTKLPYKNNRRNTKLFKYSPGLLFPWADRIIWEDAKLLQANPKQPDTSRYVIPSDYHYHFKHTVERFRTCSSYMSLPLHKASVGKVTAVTLKAHCDTIIDAARKRPTVSDSLEVVQKQCNLYEEMYKNLDEQSSHIHAQNPLSDTAFIVYDMRTSSCKKFVGDFGCSMLDEIHCYSDRDQISFPSVMASSGLKLSPELDVEGSETRDRVYVNNNNVPMLHMAKRTCHWYYGNFSNCAVTGKEITVQKEYKPQEMVKHGKLNIAVVVAGSINRMMFQSTLENLIKPMAEGNRVDYYGSFITQKLQAYRSALIYPDYFQRDPYVPKTDDTDKILSFMSTKITQFGGNVEALNIEKVVDIDSEPMLLLRRSQHLKKYPNEDSDTRFPIWDVRSQATMERTGAANKNLLRMHLAIRYLWKVALQVEEKGRFKYDYVIFMRDDSLWLDKFNINNLNNKEGDIFVLSCDDRNPPLDAMEENDHIMITRRKHADVFGDYYKVLFHTDVNGCMNRLSEKIKLNGKRGCNSEMLLKWIIDTKQIKVTRVSQSEIPFQRSGNIRLPDGSNKQCFHKFCQSKASPLIPKEKIEECKDIDWKYLTEIS